MKESEGVERLREEVRIWEQDWGSGERGWRD